MPPKKKNVDKKSEEKKSADKKSEEKKSADKKSEEKKSADKKSEEKKSADKKSEEKKSVDKKELTKATNNAPKKSDGLEQNTKQTKKTNVVEPKKVSKSADSHDKKEKTKQDQEGPKKNENVNTDGKRRTLLPQAPRPSMLNTNVKKVSAATEEELMAKAKAREENEKRLSQIRISNSRASRYKHFEPLQYPKEGLRSTTTFSSSSSASNLKLEIVGTYIDKNHYNLIKKNGTKLEIYHMEYDNQTLIDKIETNVTPIFLEMIKDDSNNDIICVLSKSKRIILFKYENGQHTKCHDKQVEATYGTEFARVVSSFEPTTNILALAFEKDNLVFVYWQNNEAKHKVVAVQSKLILNILLVSTGRDDLINVITQSRQSNICMEKHVRKLNTKTWTLTEYKTLSEETRPGHLIAVPAPLHGHLEISSNFFKYCHGSFSYIERCEKWNHKYVSFGVLSSNKFYALTKENDIILIRPVVAHEGSKKVVDLHVHYIHHTYDLVDILPFDEFILCLRMVDKSLSYENLNRERPSLNYKLTDRTENETEVEPESPPPIRGPNGAVAVMKASEPTTGDLLRERWHLKAKIGSGSYAYVLEVFDLKDKVKRVMKVQKAQPTQNSVVREMKFLKELQKANYPSGFAKMFDDFQHFEHWHCIVLSHEGITIHSLLRNSHWKFLDENVERIGQRLFTILHSLHNLGFVHRDVHNANWLVKELDGKLSFTLIDYGYTTKIQETVKKEGLHCQHASVYVCNGERYKTYDDYSSVQFCLMMMAGYSDLFSVNNDGTTYQQQKEELIAKKERFHENPMKKFTDVDHEWLGHLYLLIEKCRDDKLDAHAEVMKFYNTKHTDSIEIKKEKDGFKIL